MKQAFIYFMLLFQTNALCADFFSPAQPLLSASIDENQKLAKIAFGSCFDQRNQDTISLGKQIQISFFYLETMFIPIAKPMILICDLLERLTGS